MVIDSGDSITFTVPIHEGYAISHATQKLPLGGRDLTKYLTDLVSSTTSYGQFDSDTARELKEKLCYVVPNYEEALLEADVSHA